MTKIVFKEHQNTIRKTVQVSQTHLVSIPSITAVRSISPSFDLSSRGPCLSVLFLFVLRAPFPHPSLSIIFILPLLFSSLPLIIECKGLHLVIPMGSSSSSPLPSPSNSAIYIWQLALILRSSQARAFSFPAGVRPSTPPSPPSSSNCCSRPLS